MNRIVVVGSTGSGKTTLATGLAEILSLRHVELDALHWDPNWTPAPTDLFRERVERALDRDRWVVDGNYRKVRDLVWGRADTIVWLDYSLALIYWRLVRRTIARVHSGKELWNGNRESFREAFLSRESIFLWALKTYRRRKREYSELFQRSEYSRLAIFRHRSPPETERWLGNISRAIR
ncbi:MAG: adenylate kinase [Chloroflexota bacterium]